jgi:hypothetical protein
VHVFQHQAVNARFPKNFRLVRRLPFDLGQTQSAGWRSRQRANVDHGDDGLAVRKKRLWFWHGDGSLSPLNANPSPEDFSWDLSKFRCGALRKRLVVRGSRGKMAS